MAPLPTSILRARGALSALLPLKGVNVGFRHQDETRKFLWSPLTTAVGSTSPSNSAIQAQEARTASLPPLVPPRAALNPKALSRTVRDLVRQGQHVQALRLLLHREPALPVRPPLPLARTLAGAFDAALVSAARRGDSEGALALTARMWSLRLPIGHVAHASTLGALCKDNNLHGALKYLRSISTRHVDTRLANIVLQAAASQGDTASFDATLALMRRRHLDHDGATWAARMSLAASTGDDEGVTGLIQDALCALPPAQHAKARAGHAVALARMGDFDAMLEALTELFDRHSTHLPLPVDVQGGVGPGGAPTAPIPPEVQTLRTACNAALTAAEEVGSLAAVNGVRQLMIQRGLTPDGATYDVMMAAALRRGAGAADAIEDAWREMEGLGIKPTPRGWRLRLAALARAADGERAEAVLAEMEGAGVPLDAGGQAAAFAALGAGGDLQALRSFFLDRLAKGAVASAQAFAGAYGGVLAWARAQADARAGALAADAEGWAGREREGAGPPTDAPPGVGPAAASGPQRTPLPRRAPGQDASRVSQRHLAAALVRAMEDAQAVVEVAHDASSLAALVGALGATGAAGRVRTLLAGSGVAPSQALLNAGVAACAREGRVADAARLLADFRGAGVAPDARTYTSLIAGCSFGRQGALAWDLLGRMRERGLAPGAPTFNALVKVECHVAGPDGGLAAVNAMLTAGVKPDVVTWTTLLAAGRQAGREDVVQQALEELRALQATREDAARDAQWRGHYAVDEDDEW
uniref:PROP1-like PPR domain-containing protein n=1 Tax=Auxenochlorella protothecoides TaxID=3075 RepID=A0A1D2A084_AUXPR